MSYLKEFYDVLKNNETYELNEKEKNILSKVDNLLQTKEDGYILLYFMNYTFDKKYINKESYKEKFIASSKDHKKHMLKISNTVIQYIDIMNNGEDYTYNLHMSILQKIFISIYGEYIDKYNTLIDIVESYIISTIVGEDYFIRKSALMFICENIELDRDLNMPLSVTFKSINDIYPSQIILNVDYKRNTIYVFPYNISIPFDNIRDLDNNIITKYNMIDLKFLSSLYKSIRIKNDCLYDNFIHYFYNSNKINDNEYDGIYDDMCIINNYLDKYFSYFDNYFKNYKNTISLIKLSLEMIENGYTSLEKYLDKINKNKDQFLKDFKINPELVDIFFKFNNFNNGLLNLIIFVNDIKRNSIGITKEYSIDKEIMFINNKFI